MLVDFHHVGIVVPDLEQGSQFYCDVFGFEEVGRFEMDTAKQAWVQKVTGLADGAGRAIQLKGKNGFLEIFEFSHPVLNRDRPEPFHPGFAHIAFQVTEIERVVERFVTAGGSTHGPPHPVGKAIAIYGRDPFGNIVELLEFVAEKAHFKR